MAKKGVYKIEGNTSPKIGEKAFYKVVEWYPATPLSDRIQSKVTWELFIKDNGKFRPANLKKPVGEFTFGKNADKFTYRVEGYLHRPEGKEPMSIIVQPQKNENPKPTAKKEILGVSLTYQDGSKITKTLNYQDRLRATAKCQALEGENIIFYLWEDDEKNSGHNKKNQFIEKSPIIQVDSKGYARWDFTLLRTFISLAQKREDEDKKHEYYVTAEYNGKILNNSGNVNVNNPEPRIKITPKSSSSEAKPKTPPTVNKPKPQPDSPKGSTHQGSKNNQPDKKGIIKSIKLTDLKGNAFKKRPKFGERIQLVIDGKDIKGKSYRLKIWEDDTTGKNDLLYNREHKFNGDRQIVYIDLTDDMQRVGEIGNNPKEPDSGEYWTGNYQEIYAEVILQNITTKSQIIDVDIKAEAKKQENTKTATNMGKTETSKSSSTCICKDEYKLIWGNKLTCSQRKKVVEVCKNIWGEGKKIEKANELMAIMNLETVGTFSPSKKGVSKSGTSFIGLIQFSESTAKKLGTSYAALGKMTFNDQMVYVEEYLKQNKDKMNTIVDFYLQVIKPSDVGKGNDKEHAVFDESISVPDGDGSKTSHEQRLKNINAEPWVTKYGYSSNPTFMFENNEKIKRKRWVYTRQVYEERYGSIGGKTHIWEIEKALKDEHYKPGENNRYTGACEDKPEEKKKTDGRRAPWVDVGFEEFEKYKGLVEKQSPLKERISEYFVGTGNSDLDYTAPWCAAFIRWCFDHTADYKNINSKGTAAAYDWAEYGNSKVINNKYVDGWKDGEKCDPFVGAIITFNFSHTAILVGENLKGDKYIYLGGNQGNGDSRSGYQKICLGSISKTSSKIFMIMKPKKYTVDDEEKKLPKYDVEAENSAGSSR